MRYGTARRHTLPPAFSLGSQKHLIAEVQLTLKQGVWFYRNKDLVSHHPKGNGNRHHHSLWSELHFTKHFLTPCVTGDSSKPYERVAYSHCTDEETEAPGRGVTCLGSPGDLWSSDSRESLSNFLPVCRGAVGGGGGLQTWVGRNKGSNVLPGRPDEWWYFLWTDQPATHPHPPPSRPKYTRTLSTCGGHKGGRQASPALNKLAV